MRMFGSHIFKFLIIAGSGVFLLKDGSLLNLSIIYAILGLGTVPEQSLYYGQGKSY